MLRWMPTVRTEAFILHQLSRILNADLSLQVVPNSRLNQPCRIPVIAWSGEVAARRWHAATVLPARHLPPPWRSSPHS